MIYILVPRNVFNIHSIVNSLVSCNVGKIPETWSVRRLKYIYIHIKSHTYPTSTSSSSCFEVQGTWIRDISPTMGTTKNIKKQAP